ncbi:MAG: sigma-70 family RNA polymerase sigma factor, partial [Lawsonibacter sp.]|nr:sigma-70 family RNA polymerase sigma factor [Lawsonibacter sp.]
MSGQALSREGGAWTQEELEALSPEELFQAYKATGDPELKWPLVMRYVGLVRSIALQVRDVYSSFAQVDDIVNEGLLTLASAVDKFDPGKGIKFETYVSKRIRGAVIDLARRQDWVPRSVRRKARDIDQASSE